MRCLVLNARGLGNQHEIHELQRLLAERCPSLVFICETKVCNYQSSLWKDKFKFKGQLGVDCVRRSGGLLLFWKENIDSSIQSYSVGHIDCIVQQGLKQ